MFALPRFKLALQERGAKTCKELAEDDCKTVNFYRSSTCIILYTDSENDGVSKKSTLPRVHSQVPCQYSWCRTFFLSGTTSSFDSSFFSAGRLCTTKGKMGVNCDCVSGSPNGNALKIGPQHVSQRDHGTVTLQTRFRRLWVYVNPSATRRMSEVWTPIVTNSLQRNAPAVNFMKVTKWATDITVNSALVPVLPPPCVPYRMPPVPAPAFSNVISLRWLQWWLGTARSAMPCATRLMWLWQPCHVLA